MMRCPECGHDRTVVKDSRLNHTSNSVRRRRACLSCRHVWTTYEITTPPTEIFQAIDVIVNSADALRIFVQKGKS